jgi:predicted nucleotidyltransferase
MLTEKQLKIFGLLGKNTFKEYTFKELKASSKEKSHSLLQNAIRKFLKEELITERKIGNSKLYTINHNNEKVHNYLGLHNQESLSKPVQTSIKYVREALDKEEIFYSLIIFGSYADRTFTKKSDLDLAVFIPNEIKNKRIEIALNSASNKTLIEIDYHVITVKELEEMLKADYENLGKQIARKNIPIYNISIFYKLIIKGIKNGFNPLS